MKTRITQSLVLLTLLTCCHVSDGQEQQPMQEIGRAAAEKKAEMLFDAGWRAAQEGDRKTTLQKIQATVDLASRDLSEAILSHQPNSAERKSAARLANMGFRLEAVVNELQRASKVEESHKRLLFEIGSDMGFVEDVDLSGESDGYGGEYGGEYGGGYGGGYGGSEVRGDGYGGGGYGGYGGGGGGGGGGYGTGAGNAGGYAGFGDGVGSEEVELYDELSLLRQMFSRGDATDKAKLSMAIRKLVEEEFDVVTNRRKKQFGQLEKRLEQLRKQLARRTEARDDIIDVRVKTLMLEAQGFHIRRLEKQSKDGGDESGLDEADPFGDF